MDKILTKYSKILMCVALALVTLAVFWPVYEYEFVNWDDPLNVVDNPNVNEGVSIQSIRWAFT